MRFHLKRFVLAVICVFGFVGVFHPLLNENVRRTVGEEQWQPRGVELSFETLAVATRKPENLTARPPAAPKSTKTYTVPDVASWSVNDSLRQWLPDARNTLPNYFTMRDDFRADDPRYKEGALVYSHLNKAAGTTTKRCLRMISSKTVRSLGPVMDSSGRSNMQVRLARDKNRYKILMGGYAFGICDFMTNSTCSYFTILRDPYERVISSYTYCRRAGMDQTCRALGPWDASLKEWAIHQGSYFFRQLLLKPWFCTANSRGNARYGDLSGVPHSPGASFNSAPCWFKEKVILKQSLSESDMDLLLRYSVGHLEDWFSMIGITDEYDLSLAMLERVYDLPFRKTCSGDKSNTSDYKNLSENKRNTSDTTLPDMVSQLKAELQADPEVRAALHADIALYDKALDIFAREKRIFLDNLET
ncbi:uncharacterized protein [Diadema antillarum]|uniref:uncharacterized protein n=1 Tax=Diadema antillarum TaxID=105358 RepID=UPI003A891DEE